MLNAANILHPTAQFTLENSIEKANLAFLDNNFNMDSLRNVICGWYQKLTDTGTFIEFKSCDPFHYQKNKLEAHQFGISFKRPRR